MKAIYSSETSVLLIRAARRHIPEDCIVQVAGKWRKLHNEELHNWSSHPKVISDEANGDEFDRACSTN
jgi:hypothetical protein